MHDSWLTYRLITWKPLIRTNQNVALTALHANAPGAYRTGFVMKMEIVQKNVQMNVVLIQIVM